MDTLTDRILDVELEKNENPIYGSILLLPFLFFFFFFVLLCFFSSLFFFAENKSLKTSCNILETNITSKQKKKKKKKKKGLNRTPTVGLREAVKEAVDSDPLLRGEDPTGWILLALNSVKPEKLIHGLNTDEVAAIQFYTQSTPFYQVRFPYFPFPLYFIKENPIKPDETKA